MSSEAAAETSSEMTDLELIGRVMCKEADALEAIYAKYERPIYTFAFRIVQDAMLAEEVVQELFLRLWNAAEKYDSAHGKLTSWMFTLTRNIAIDRLRRRQLRTATQVVEDERLTRAPDTAPNTEQIVEAAAVGEEVRSAMQQLNEDQRQVIEWIYFAGYTQQEVADRHRIPLGTVKSRVRLALKALKRQLAGLGEEGPGYERGANWL